MHLSIIYIGIYIIWIIECFLNQLYVYNYENNIYD